MDFNLSGNGEEAPQGLLHVLDAIQNPPSYVPTSLDIKKVSLKYVASSASKGAIPPFDSINELLEAAEQIYKYFNNK